MVYVFIFLNSLFISSDQTSQGTPFCPDRGMCCHVDYPCRFILAQAQHEAVIPHRVFSPACLLPQVEAVVLPHLPACLAAAHAVLGVHPFSHLDVLIVPPGFSSLGMARWVMEWICSPWRWPKFGVFSLSSVYIPPLVIFIFTWLIRNAMKAKFRWTVLFFPGFVSPLITFCWVPVQVQTKSISWPVKPLHNLCPLCVWQLCSNFPFVHQGG